VDERSIGISSCWGVRGTVHAQNEMLMTLQADVGGFPNACPPPEATTSLTQHQINDHPASRLCKLLHWNRKARPATLAA
jgi:hypothetical protein